MRIKSLSIAYLFLGIFALTSCESEVPQLIQPSTDLVNVEGEGDSVEITFHDGNWIIDRIENRSMNGEYISGDISSAEGEVVAENTQLQLSGLGKIASGWRDHGFEIVRQRMDALQVNIRENWTDADFSFAIVLQSGEEEKAIIVNQKRSQGYTFNKIEFAVGPDDADTFNDEVHRRSYPSSAEPTQLPLTPYTGLKEISCFTSAQPEDLFFLERYNVTVQVPIEIDPQTKEITTYSGYENHFSADPTTKDSKYLNVIIPVDLPAGYPFVTVTVTFRKRQLTYYATFTNNRTGELRVISGKWIETAPTHKYEISVTSY